MYSDNHPDRQNAIELDENNEDTSFEVSANRDAGQIVEVIEMANGEAIW